MDVATREVLAKTFGSTGSADILSAFLKPALPGVLQEPPDGYYILSNSVVSGKPARLTRIFHKIFVLTLAVLRLSA